MIKQRPKIARRVVLLVVVISLLPALSRPALADDHSYSTVISHIKSNYNAKGQSFFGMMNFARFLVKIIKPAGVKNFKVTMLRDVDYSRGPRPETPSFHEFVRGTIHPSWQPLIQYSSRKEKQWTYVYSQPERDDIKVLVVTMQEHDAFVLQFKFSPEKLSAFVNDPKIMGISLKDDHKGNPAAVDGSRAPDAGNADAEKNEDKPKEKPPQEQAKL
jgi:hypothetical protein